MNDGAAWGDLRVGDRVRVRGRTPPRSFVVVELRAAHDDFGSGGAGAVAIVRDDQGDDHTVLAQQLARL